MIHNRSCHHRLRVRFRVLEKSTAHAGAIRRVRGQGCVASVVIFTDEPGPSRAFVRQHANAADNVILWDCSRLNIYGMTCRERSHPVGKSLCIDAGGTGSAWVDLALFAQLQLQKIRVHRATMGLPLAIGMEAVSDTSVLFFLTLYMAFITYTEYLAEYPNQELLGECHVTVIA
ncbi:hypothetical protein EDB89DRAFT_1634871 [Lactarius sanguifluus]|nr:hypothetical protein EDB89DRAFT_1634871 [Lactarius sanguifluus]